MIATPTTPLNLSLNTNINAEKKTKLIYERKNYQ